MESETVKTHPGEDDEEEVDATMTSSWFIVDDETSAELSKLLDMFFEAPPPPFRVRFIDDPYSASVVFHSSSSFVTINGNDESCGSSFSDLESSAMASIDRSSLLGTWGFFSSDGCHESNDDDVAYDLEGLLNDFDGYEGAFPSP